MVMNEKSVFIGSDQGVIAGYRNARNWVWTLLSAGEPGFVNDLLVAGEVLFIASDEGLFRFYKGRMERLSTIPCRSLAADSSFLAAVNPDSVMLFFFAPSASSKGLSRPGSVPEVGSFTPSLPVISMVPMPDLQMGRLPDFQALEKKRIAEGDSKVASSTENETDLSKTEKGFPAELQIPVFSSLQKINNRYYLATKNRGLWWFEDGKWFQVEALPSVGIDSLASSKENSLYAYGNRKGVYRVDNASVACIITEDKTNGLLDLYVAEDEELLMLFDTGDIIAKSKDAQAVNLAQIPGEFKGEFHSLWKSGKNLVVVVDRGILIQESDKQWNLLFYKGRIEGSRVTSATEGDNQSVYIGINDGRVFRFVSGRLEFVATIKDQPVEMNYAGCLWVAGNESLYFLENNSLIPTPFHAREKILGAFPVTDSKSVLVFTGSGIKYIAGRQ
jgi:hypothetical protein